jgi:hypothetical protein
LFLAHIRMLGTASLPRIIITAPRLGIRGKSWS